MGDTFSSAMKGMKEQHLCTLWEAHEDDVVGGFPVQEQLTQPTVPAIQDTKLGCIIWKKYQDAITTGNNLDDEDLQKITKNFWSCAIQGELLVFNVASN